ncbi:MAG: DUF4193 family protein [Acidimicrobiales bacterium]
MPHDLDEVDEPDALVDDDLEVEDDLGVDEPDELVVVDDDDDDLGVSTDLLDDDDEDEDEPAPVAAKADEDDDEEEDEDEDEVEASLDVILKERLVVEEVEDDEDELTEVDERSDGVERVLPKQPGEFVCRSCFLVKHPSQLADATRMLCRDCV